MQTDHIPTDGIVRCIESRDAFEGGKISVVAYLLREAFQAGNIATPKAHYAAPAGFPTRSIQPG